MGSPASHSSRSSSVRLVHSPRAESSASDPASPASNSRAAAAACSAGTPSARASSARAGPRAPSARKASSGHTPAAENTDYPEDTPAHRAVSPFTAWVVAPVIGIPPPPAPRIPCALSYVSSPPLLNQEHGYPCPYPRPLGPTSPTPPGGRPPPRTRSGRRRRDNSRMGSSRTGSSRTDSRTGNPMARRTRPGDRATAPTPARRRSTVSPSPPWCSASCAASRRWGLVLGVIALVQIKKKGQSGKALAITGSILSSLGLALWVTVLATGGLSDAWEGFKKGASEGATFSVVKGQCFDAPGESLEGLTYDVDQVPCAGEHDGEVFGEVQDDRRRRLPGGRRRLRRRRREVLPPPGRLRHGHLVAPRRRRRVLLRPPPGRAGASATARSAASSAAPTRRPP